MAFRARSRRRSAGDVGVRLRRRGRRDAVFVVAGFLCVAGFVFTLLRGPSSVEVVPLPSVPGSVSTAPTVSPAPCDDAPSDDGACRSEVPFLDLLTSEAAAARLVAGSPLPEDVRFLLLSETDWGILFGSYLGQAALVPGGEFVPAGRMAKAWSEVPAEFGWQQEWRGDGFVLVEQVLAFAGPDAAADFLAAWESASSSEGLDPFDLGAAVGEFAGDALGEVSVATAFVDLDAVGFFADRRCGADVAVTAGTVVFVVTFFEGAGCSSPRLAPAPMAAQGLRDRLVFILESV